MKESLPNITGSINFSIDRTTGNGALKTSPITTPGDYLLSTSSYAKYNTTFDASRSSSVYQGNAHVTPFSITTAFIIKY